MQYILFSLLFIYSATANAQPGCTDPQANNFDANATQNDGSCTYSPTDYALTEITTLPNALEEASGAAFVNGNLWTHEDANNEDRIYQIDSLTGAVQHLVTIANADNIDWEDLAEDETHIYIGDFGNNDGNRMNLRIYKVAKADLDANVATPEVIEFEYSDQTDFSIQNNNNNFDCEAFFVYQDSLHLFSKNWVDFQTRHYVLPTTAGSWVAQVRDSMFVEGQITSADISGAGEVLLLGYNVVTGANFFWLLFDLPNTQFFHGNKRKIQLGNALTNSQTEGVTFREEGNGYVISEKFSVLNQKLLRFNIRQYTDNTTAVNAPPAMANAPSVFPNPFQNELTIANANALTVARIVDVMGRVVLEWKLDSQQTHTNIQLTIPTQQLKPGYYLIELVTQSGVVFTQKLIFNGN